MAKKNKRKMIYKRVIRSVANGVNDAKKEEGCMDRETICSIRIEPTDIELPGEDNPNEELVDPNDTSCFDIPIRRFGEGQDIFVGAIMHSLAGGEKD